MKEIEKVAVVGAGIMGRGIAHVCALGDFKVNLQDVSEEIAQAFGLELSFATQFTILLIALLTSIGVAGIPAASLVAITIILSAIGLPLEAVGVILAVDRLLDMFRTSVNVFSDSCGAVIIARSEGETGILAGSAELPKE